MSERQYVTELRVNAPTDQVVKLNDALRNVQSTIQAIRSAGPVAPAVGAGAGAMGGAVAPMGGGGGFAGGGPGGGMPTAWGGAGGGGGWAAGGGFAGGGGAPGGGGGFAGRVGRIGNALPTTGQGAVVGAATAIGGLVGMGAFTGAIAADYLRSVDKAVQTDRARSRLRGLTGGAVRWVGGSAYGYTPAEAAEIATQAAQTGVAGAGNVLNLSTLALQMERMGIGAGAGMGLAGAFALGGGAAGGPGQAAETVRATFGLAVKMGLENAQIPALLEKVAGATTAMAEQGADVDVGTILRNIAQVREMGGGASALAGTRAAEVYQNIDELARAVASGGGTPIQQEVMLRAVGLGQIDPETGERIDLVRARSLLLQRRFKTEDVIRQMRMAGGGDAGGSAMFGADVLKIGSIAQTLALAQGRGTGTDYTNLSDVGAERLREGARAATSALMRRDARTEARDVDMGFKGAKSVFTLRESFQDLRATVADKLIVPMINEAAKVAKDASNAGWAEAVANFMKRQADPAKRQKKPTGSKGGPNKRGFYFVQDPDESQGPGQRGSQTPAGEKYPNLSIPGVFRLELGPGVEDFFRIIQDPGVPA